MKKIRNISIFFILLIGVILMFTPLSMIQSRDAVNGIIDLSNGIFKEDNIINIGGQWELYYNKFLSPDEVKTVKPDGYYNVPGILQNQVKGHNSGYMTLHFKIKVPYDTIYGMKIDNMYTSSEVYVNGNKVDGHGQVGTTAEKEKPTYRPMAFYFNSINREVDVVIHTSVYRDEQPNITRVIFGTKNKVSEKVYSGVFVDSFIIGILTIAALINLGCYSPKHKQKGNLYFAIMCMILILQQSISESRILCQIIGYVPYEIINKISFVSINLLSIFYILFIDNVFKQNMKIKKAVIFYGVSFAVLCITTDSSIYTKARGFSQLIVTIFMIYILFFIAKRVQERDKKVKGVIIPLLILIMCTINGILVSNRALDGNYISVFGVLIFVISQSMYIVKEYVGNYYRLQQLNRDSLTSLYTNKYIKKLINRQVEKYKEKNREFSLMMIDIDNFKSINDNFGHMFGDKVIKDVADVIKKSVDAGKYIGRFGGDEFVVILPLGTKDEAMELAENISYKVGELHKGYEIERKITLSIGVYENKAESMEECMKCVDSAMYNAKKSGKGRVTSY